MRVYKRPASPYWWLSHTYTDGRRLRRSTALRHDDTRKVDAERAAQRLVDALEAPAKRKTPFDLSEAALRFWTEVAQHQPSAPATEYQLALLLADFGAHVPLAEIDDERLARRIAARRAERRRERYFDRPSGTALRRPAKEVEKNPRITPRTVNAETQVLQRLLNRARKIWKVPGLQEIAWEAHWLEEAELRTRGATFDEEERLIAALPEDLAAIVTFAMLSGIRKSALIFLEWRQVDWREGVVEIRLKSKRPGGRLQRVPITPAMAAILRSRYGHHPERVFTFTAMRTRRFPGLRVVQFIKGQRYPYGRNGWPRQFKAACKAAGIPSFRFHDTRHTAATRTLARTGNLKLVQLQLGHSSIAETAKYSHADLRDLRAAMEATHAAVRPIAGHSEGTDILPQAGQAAGRIR